MIHRPRAVCMLAARAWRVPFPRSRRQSNAPDPKFVVVCLVTRNLHDVHGTAFILCDRTLRSSFDAEGRGWSGIAGTGRSEACAGKRTGRTLKRCRGNGEGPEDVLPPNPPQSPGAPQDAFCPCASEGSGARPGSLLVSRKGLHRMRSSAATAAASLVSRRAPQPCVNGRWAATRTGEEQRAARAPCSSLSDAAARRSSGCSASITAAVSPAGRAIDRGSGSAGTA